MYAPDPSVCPRLLALSSLSARVCARTRSMICHVSAPASCPPWPALDYGLPARELLAFEFARRDLGGAARQSSRQPSNSRQRRGWPGGTAERHQPPGPAAIASTFPCVAPCGDRFRCGLPYVCPNASNHGWDAVCGRFGVLQLRGCSSCAYRHIRVHITASLWAAPGCLAVCIAPADTGGLPMTTRSPRGRRRRAQRPAGNRPASRDTGRDG